MKQLANQVLDNMHLINSYIMGVKNTVLAKHNMGRASYGFLSHIHHNGQMSGKDLAAQLGISTSAVTQFVDILDDQKLIIRKTDPLDKRVILLSLSKKGQNLFATLKNELSQYFLDVLADSNEQELLSFLKFQECMLERLNTLKK